MCLISAAFARAEEIISSAEQTTVLRGTAEVNDGIRAVTLSWYIHLNPCNGKRPLVQDLGQWAHSSYPGFARKTSRVD
jgi:hypothetical protein